MTKISKPSLAALTAISAVSLGLVAPVFSVASAAPSKLKDTRLPGGLSPHDLVNIAGEFKNLQSLILKPATAVSLCTDVMAAPVRAKTMLGLKGWKPVSLTSKTSRVYGQPGAGIYHKGPSIITYASAKAAIGAGEPATLGACQIVMPGSSSIAATELAAKYSKAAKTYSPEKDHVFASFDFIHGGQLINVADMEKGKDSKDTGTMRIVVTGK